MGIFVNFQRFCFDHKAFFRGFRGFLVHYRFQSYFLGNPNNAWISLPSSFNFVENNSLTYCLCRFGGYKTIQSLAWLLHYSFFRGMIYKLMRTHLDYLYIRFSFNHNIYISCWFPQFPNWGFTYYLFRISFTFWHQFRHHFDIIFDIILTSFWHPFWHYFVIIFDIILVYCQL